VINGAPSWQGEDLSLLVERNWILFAQGRFTEAKPSVEKALSMAREPATLMQAGLLALQEGRNEAGRALLEEVLQREPANVEALLAIARSHASEKRIPAALDRVRKQAALRPDSAELQLALGSMLEQTGDLAGARAAYATALQANPASIPALVANARMDMIGGQWNASRQKIQTALDKAPGNVDALLALGMLEEATGHVNEAIKAYRAVLQADPAHPAAKNNLANRLAENRATVDEALLLALELKRAHPEDPEIDDTLGWVHYKRGSLEEAVRAFTRADARKKSARFRFHLAMAHFAAGNRQLGEKALAAAIQIDPNAPEAAEARRLAESAP
jgi:tetratricopeptide (TPR) repeat protein